MSWIGELQRLTYNRTVEVIILGDDRVLELIQWAQDLSWAPDCKGESKVVTFMGVTLVAVRGPYPARVEAHYRDEYTGQPMIHVLRL